MILIDLIYMAVIVAILTVIFNLAQNGLSLILKFMGFILYNVLTWITVK